MSFMTGVIAAAVIFIGVAAPDVAFAADENGKIFESFKNEYCKTDFWKDIQDKCQNSTDFPKLKDLVQATYTNCFKKTKADHSGYDISDSQISALCGGSDKDMRELSIEAYFRGAKNSSCSSTNAPVGIPSAPQKAAR